MMYSSQLIADKTWLILECGYDAIYYVEGDTKGLLIDTGTGVGDLKAFVDALATKPYDVLLTHGHLDHIGASLQYPRVIVNRGDWELIRKSINNEERRYFLENMEIMSEGRVPNQDSSQMRLYEGTLPEFIDIDDGAVIDLGNRQLHVHLTPGHTMGSICLADEERGIVFVGDTIIYRLLLMTGPQDYRERLKVWWDATAFLYDEAHPYKALYMGHCGIVPDYTYTELRQSAKILMDDFSQAIYEGTSPKYLLGQTQLYLGPPLSLQFGSVK